MTSRSGTITLRRGEQNRIPTLFDDASRADALPRGTGSPLAEIKATVDTVAELTPNIMQHDSLVEIGLAALRFIDRTLCAVCAVIIVAFSAMLIAQVGLRQAGHPLFWVEELCQYLMVYLCFLGSAIAWGRREHLTVEFLPSLLGEGRRRALLIMVDGVVLVFAAWATFASAEFTLFSMRKMSISLDAPVGYGYIGAPIGFGIIALQSLIFIACGRGAPGFLAHERELEEVGM